VVEEYKTWQAMMLRNSKDVRVRQADIEVRTGRKGIGRRRSARNMLTSSGQWPREGNRFLNQGKLAVGESEGLAWDGAEGGP